MKCKKGHKMKKGKCINSKKKKSSKRVSYNPFKMWGSYVGVILGITLLPDLFFKQIDTLACAPLLLIFMWVVGFLVGWGIHSLIRFLRNEFR